MVFWIVAGILITGAVLVLSLVTTAKAYDYRHKIDPLPQGRRMEEEEAKSMMVGFFLIICFRIILR